MGLKFPCGVEICIDVNSKENLEYLAKMECPIHGKLCTKRMENKSLDEEFCKCGLAIRGYSGGYSHCIRCHYIVNMSNHECFR